MVLVTYENEIYRACLRARASKRLNMYVLRKNSPSFFLEITHTFQLYRSLPATVIQCKIVLYHVLHTVTQSNDRIDSTCFQFLNFQNLKFLNSFRSIHFNTLMLIYTLPSRERISFGIYYSTCNQFLLSCRY